MNRNIFLIYSFQNLMKYKVSILYAHLPICTFLTYDREEKNRIECSRADLKINIRIYIKYPTSSFTQTLLFCWKEWMSQALWTFLMKLTNDDDACTLWTTPLPKKHQKGHVKAHEWSIIKAKICTQNICTKYVWCVYTTF